MHMPVDVTLDREGAHHLPYMQISRLHAPAVHQQGASPGLVCVLHKHHCRARNGRSIAIAAAAAAAFTAVQVALVANLHRQGSGEG